MNKPYRLPSRTQSENRSQSSPATGKVAETNGDSYYRRRGLSTAEQIVTLILRRYGLDEESIEEESESNMQAKEEASVAAGEITAEREADKIQNVNDKPLPVTLDSPALPAQQLMLWG